MSSANRAPINANDDDEFSLATALDAVRDRLAPLEDRFYDLVDEAVYPAGAKYIRAHADEFVR